MIWYLVRRAVSSVAVLFGASVLVFVLVVGMGDPLAALRARNPPVPRELIEQRERELNLDKPLPQRYTIWLNGFVTGDWGKTVNEQDVRPLVWERFQTSVTLLLAAGSIALLLAIADGIAAAVYEGSWVDKTSSIFALASMSMPVFWFASILQEFVAIRINDAFNRQLIFTAGTETPEFSGNWWAVFNDRLGHLILPAIAIALTTYASWSRYLRNSLIGSLDSDYMRLARAKGLPFFRALRKHALRNAILPFSTVVALDISGILSGVVIVEQIFGWSGMGTLIIDGIQQNDVSVVLAWLMVSATIVILINFAIDLLYGVIDPRISDVS